MKSSLKVILCYVVAIALIFGVIAFIYRGTSNGEEPPTYTEFIAMLQRGEVASFELDYEDGKLTYIAFRTGSTEVKLDDGTTERRVTLLDDVGNVVATLNADGSLPDSVSLETIKTKACRAPVSIKLADLPASREELMPYVEEQLAEENGVGILQDTDLIPVTTYPWWVSLLPYVLIIVVVIALYAYAMKKMMSGGGGPAGKMGGFGKAHVKTPLDEKNKVTFADVAGADEEKEELVEIVDYLKDPTKFARLGARIPHGVLLMGPPGTGKTLLAKAVAGEAGVPFFSISGSDFVEMYVGVGASRVRDLFETARKAGSAIIFIDEIDAVGRQRGTGLGGGHDEREQTLNQLLVEMDGFGSHEGIVVIAATNRADVLDPALLRPGRFDRQISVNRPNLKGREDILKVHARNKPIEPDVDLAKVAKITVGFTGADLANLLNEAALLAARKSKSLIGMDEIEDALNKILMGPKKKTNLMNDKEKKNTAYHEAGHAVIGYLVGSDTVHQITIVPTGRGALGYTSFRPEADRYQMYKQEYKNEIAMMLGGRAAEELIFGDVTSGAYSDIERATATAKRMVTLFGMSEKLGPRRFGSDQSEVFLGRDFSSNADYSDATAAAIDEEIHAIISEAYDRAKTLLTENMQKLTFIADYLVAHEDMDGDQFKAVMETSADDLTVEMIEEIAAEKLRRSREANEARAKAEAEKEEADRLAREAEEAAETAEAEESAEAEKIPSEDQPSDSDSDEKTE